MYLGIHVGVWLRESMGVALYECLGVRGYGSVYSFGSIVYVRIYEFIGTHVGGKV